MKKIIIISISILLSTLSARADIVPQSRAKSVASQFMESSSLTLVWDGTEVATKAADDPAFYVYNVAGGGWVMVSGDDCVAPILAYSDTGKFVSEGMPDNMRAWLGSMREDILRARTAKVVAKAAVKARWASPKRYVTKSGESTKILTTAKWDQTEPYNNLLSTYVKSKGKGVSDLYTGCVATAMSILMRYHQWPEHGTGTLDSYTTDSEHYSVTGYSIEDHVYDWENMPLTDGYYPSNGWTDGQETAVAQLMADCGIMVEMDYTTEGSGAWTESVIPAMTAHMQYSNAAVLKTRANYKTSDWMSMIVNEIDNCGPIMYGGNDPSEGGHQFICDGYDLDNTMIHINWGWGGSDDAFYTFDLAVPDFCTFSEGQDAIFGLVPDRDGTSEPAEGEIQLFSWNTGTEVHGQGIELFSGTVEQGTDFIMLVGAFDCTSGDYDGALKLVIQDKDGNWKEDISNIDDCSGEDCLKAGFIYWDDDFNCNISSEIELGDRIALWYKRRDNSWAPALTPADDYSYPWTYACFDANFIAVEDSYSTGDNFYFELLPGNQSIDGITWYFDGVKTTAEYVTLTSGSHTVAVEIDFADNTSETVTQVVNVQ